MSEDELYLDENEPSVRETNTEVTVKVEADGISIQLMYDETDLTRLGWARWVGYNNDLPAHLSAPWDIDKLAFAKEVWTYLQEWELVKLRPIGPEDSEYFATQNLKIRARLGK